MKTENRGHDIENMKAENVMDQAENRGNDIMENRCQLINDIERVFRVLSKDDKYSVRPTLVSDIKSYIFAGTYTLSDVKQKLSKRVLCILMNWWAKLPYNNNTMSLTKKVYNLKEKDILVLMALGGFLNLYFNNKGLFHETSFAFRKDRNYVDFHKHLISFGGEQISCIIVYTINNLIFNISHEKLITSLKSVIHDNLILKLISDFIRMPVLLRTGDLWIPKSGIYDIELITPVLLNFYLDELDREFSKRLPGFKYARYDNQVFIPMNRGDESLLPKLKILFDELDLGFDLDYLKPEGEVLECPGGVTHLSKDGSVIIIPDSPDSRESKAGIEAQDPQWSD